MEDTVLENTVLLRGELVELPTFSHENHGKQFDRLVLAVRRLSRTEDILNVIARHTLVEALDPDAGAMLEVRGQVRSFNNRSGTGRKLVITVYAQELTVCDGEPENQVELIGTICRESVYRKTPLGREICDVMLAVTRRYRRTDYLPCILWGSVARLAAGCAVGTRLHVKGRLQSRVYVKQLEEGSEERTAFEISAITAELVEAGN